MSRFVTVGIVRTVGTFPANKNGQSTFAKRLDAWFWFPVQAGAVLRRIQRNGRRNINAGATFCQLPIVSFLPLFDVIAVQLRSGLAA